MSRAAFYITVDDKYFGLGLALAHRLSRLWRMDTHVFLENGPAREAGTPDAQGVHVHRNMLKGMRPEGLPSTHNWPPVVYDRIFAPQLLTQYDRLIYLDADIFPLASVPELLQIPLPSGLGAVQDTASIGAAPCALGISRDAWRQSIGLATKRYFNSGMLVIDPAKWVQIDFTEALREFVARHGANVRMPDQDFLNYHFQGRWTELSPRFNFQKALFNHGYETVFEPVFLHFSSFQKPWLKPDCSNSVQGQFFAHYQQMMVDAGIDPQVYRGRARETAPRRLRRKLRAGLSSLGLRTGKERRQLSEWHKRDALLRECFARDAGVGRYADLDFTIPSQSQPALFFDGQYLRRPLTLPRTT